MAKTTCYDGCLCGVSLQKRALSATSFTKSYRIALATPAPESKAFELIGTSYMHKFDEGDRFLFVWTSAVSSCGAVHGMAFIERGWILAAPYEQSHTPADRSSAIEPQTFVQTCYQISCVPETAETEAANSVAVDRDREAMRELEDLVLMALSRRTRAHQQAMQNELLDRFGQRRYRQSSSTCTV